MNITVVKINGEKEPFSEQKIRASAKRVGVPKSMLDDLVGEINSKLYDGISTKEIFEIIKSYLNRKDSGGLAAKFNLKQGLAQLGPSGYPFEKFMAHILHELGYATKTNQILAGRCVKHEVDVVAVKDGITNLIETKFHSKQGIKTDVKVTLYIKARFDDIAGNWKGLDEIKPWVITNARFTSEAIAYGECVGLALTSWNYPEGSAVRDLIEQSRLHPVTVLESISDAQKKVLLDGGIVTCKQIVNDKKVSSLLPRDVLSRAKQEAKAVCQLV